MPDPTKVLDDLYGGTLDKAAWDRAILAIGDVLRASGAVLLAFNPSSGEVLRAENHHFDGDALRDYERYWSYHDVRLEPALGAPLWCAVTERTLEIPNWRRSAILNEFLRPADVPHFMPVWLHKAEYKAVTLSFQGSCRRGPFEDEDIRYLEQLAPHLARALAIRDRLEAARVSASTLAAVLNSVSFGVVILDCRGRILEANMPATQLLGSRCGIYRAADGRLALRGPAGADLARWVLAGKPPPHNASGVLRVPRPPAAAISVVLTPLPQSSTSWVGGGDPRWVVLLFDPEKNVRVSSALIQCDLGVSPREAEVAALLVSGRSLRDIAARLCISLHTARNHLKAILHKTSLRSQSALIRRIATGPVMLASHDAERREERPP